MPKTHGPSSASPSVTWNSSFAFSVLCAALLSLSGTACGHPVREAPRVTSGDAAARGGCRGADLKLNRIAEACKVREQPKPPPPASSMRVELSPAEASVRSGEKTPVTVKVTNLTSAPMELDMQLGCRAFDISAYREGQDERVDQEYTGGCQATGGICAPGLPVRVTLEPQGSLRVDLTFAAHVLQWDKEGNECVSYLARALPPGRYGLRVQLPFSDPIPGKPQSWESRTVEGSVVVLP